MLLCCYASDLVIKYRNFMPRLHCQHLKVDIDHLLILYQRKWSINRI